MKNIIISAAFILGVALSACENQANPESISQNEDSSTNSAASEPAKSTPVRSGRERINGLNYYYEIHGKGQPLLVLHGGLGHIGMFGPVLTKLSENREVIAVDLHGHGRTQLGNRPIDPIAIGNDLDSLVKKLGYKQVDVIGYSFGGTNALRLAIQHPETVRRMVIASAPFAQSGFYPELLPQQAAMSAQMAPMLRGTPIYQSYIAVAPDSNEFPKLMDRMGEYMRKPYDWSAEIKNLKMPVMLIYGDADMFKPEHIIKFYQLLGGGLKDAGWQRENISQNRLAILPDVTHYEAFEAPALAETALPFLNK